MPPDNRITRLLPVWPVAPLKEKEKDNRAGAHPEKKSAAGKRPGKKGGDGKSRIDTYA